MSLVLFVFAGSWKYRGGCFFISSGVLFRWIRHCAAAHARKCALFCVPRVGLLCGRRDGVREKDPFDGLFARRDRLRVFCTRKPVDPQDVRRGVGLCKMPYFGVHGYTTSIWIYSHPVRSVVSCVVQWS